MTICFLTFSKSLLVRLKIIKLAPASAKAIAEAEKLELTDRHWDVINHLRDEFFNNAGNQPNTRKLVKFFEKLWGEKIDTKTLFDLFPGNPSKQAGRIGGLPESRRKGGY